MIWQRLDEIKAINGSARSVGDFIVVEDDGTVNVFTPAQMQTNHPEIRVVYSTPTMLQDHIVLREDVESAVTTTEVFQNIPGLQFPVQPGYIYSYQFVIPFGIDPDLNTGMLWGVNGPAATKVDYLTRFTGTDVYTVGTAPDTLINGNILGFVMSAAQGAYDGWSSSGISCMRWPDGNFAFIDGFVIPSAAGNVIARMATEVSSYTITIQRGASVDYKGIPV